MDKIDFYNLRIFVPGTDIPEPDWLGSPSTNPDPMEDLNTFSIHTFSPSHYYWMPVTVPDLSPPPTENPVEPIFGPLFICLPAQFIPGPGSTSNYTGGLTVSIYASEGNMEPSIPTLVLPVDGVCVSTTPIFYFFANDPDGDSLKFKIEILQNDVVVESFDQTQDQDSTYWDKADYSSDETAIFTLPENQALEPGTYQWRVYAFDDQQWSQGSQSWSFNLIEGTIRLTGYVRHFLGWPPIEGALVEAIKGNKKWSTQTDGNGDYNIYGLATGFCDMRVSAVNQPILTEFVDLNESVEINEDEKVLFKYFGLSNESGEIVKSYAPVLYFHSQEKYRPMPVELFLDHATINGVIARRSIAQDPSVGENIDLEGSQSQEYEQLFSQYKKAYYKYDPERPIAYARVYRDNQYYVIQYWFHYLNNPIPDGLAYDVLDFLLDHEGDWEMIQLIWTTSYPTLENEPAYAVYSRHTSKEMRMWSDVNKIETHPCVYVGYGTHASYFDNGDNNSGRQYVEKYGFFYLQDYTGTDGPFPATAILFPHVDNREWFQEIVQSSQNWTLFRGKWGVDRGSPICPPHKGEQWTDPISWSGL